MQNPLWHKPNSKQKRAMMRYGKTSVFRKAHGVKPLAPVTKGRTKDDKTVVGYKSKIVETMYAGEYEFHCIETKPILRKVSHTGNKPVMLDKKIP